METKVIHDEKNREFYLLTEGVKSYVSYEVIGGGMLDLQHTIVPKAVSGRGIASVLVQTACDYAQDHNLKIRATCTYAQVWLQRHPGYDYEMADCGESCPL